MTNKPSTYTSAIKAIKSAILQSRYTAAALVNKKMLSLYYGIGRYISENTRNKAWGSGAIEQISESLQKELPGLRGFSASNLKRMRSFFEAWSAILTYRPTMSGDFESTRKNIAQTENQQIEIRPSVMGDMLIDVNELLSIRQLSTAEFRLDNFDNFLKVSFSHHSNIIAQVSSPQERLFYISRVATEFLSVRSLQYHIKSNLYAQQGSLSNNFAKTIEPPIQQKAILSFKDEYLLDFINIEDPDEVDEREIEFQIVRNIKKFIMALGSDFSYIGNQYRLTMGEDEFFVDLLFFNRRIQSLVAIDLKRGKFKAEYLGKMNLYLSALDEYVKQPHENASIGIILCKEKNNTIVEFAFRDFSKPMGVATYKTASELPEPYKSLQINKDALNELLNEE
ncbi:MAG: PDDEXK nuclease domain-containing protein [Paludibacteraceae bacterium]|nr:PDDEXK nuclease domain-containing protein [Paludibacteraceae bacterium]